MIYIFPEFPTRIVNGDYCTESDAQEYIFQIPVKLPSLGEFAAVKRHCKGYALGIVYQTPENGYTVRFVDCRGTVIWSRDAENYHHALLMIQSFPTYPTQHWRRELFEGFLDDFIDLASAEFFGGEDTDLLDIVDHVCVRD